MRNTLLEELKTFVHEFTDENPEIAENSMAFGQLADVVETFSQEEATEFLWELKVHYGSIRYYPGNYTARAFMSKFMGKRVCLNNTDIYDLEAIFNVRNIILPPKQDSDIRHLKKKKGIPSRTSRDIL